MTKEPEDKKPDFHLDNNNVKIITKFILDAIVAVSCFSLSYSVVHKLLAFFLGSNP